MNEITPKGDNKPAELSKLKKLEAELERTEKDVKNQQAKLNRKKLELQKAIKEEAAAAAILRHLEFIKDKSPYWIGIEFGWTHRYLRAVISKPMIEGEKEFARANVRILEIVCDDAKKDVGMHGTVDAEFVMRTTVDCINVFMGKKYKNVSEQEFMEALNERTKPFFDMIKDATKDVFTSGNLLGPAVTHTDKTE